VYQGSACSFGANRRQARNDSRESAGAFCRLSADCTDRHVCRVHSAQGFELMTADPVTESAKAAQEIAKAINQGIAAVSGLGGWLDSIFGEAIGEAVRLHWTTNVRLWVSAYEILAHLGGTGQSNFGTASGLLEKVKWLDTKLAAATHTIPGKTPQQKQLATWICRKVYDARDDFLHGNEVDAAVLNLNKKPVTDFAACLFRLALTSFVDLNFNVAMPSKGHTTSAPSSRRRLRDLAVKSGGVKPVAMRSRACLGASATAIVSPVALCLSLSATSAFVSTKNTATATNRRRPSSRRVTDCST
jgi:hypothetical protein